MTIIVDQPLLREFAAKTRCEWCGRDSPEGLDPHHIFARGMGGGGRLDVRINLISLCRGWHKGKWVDCHDSAQQGNIDRDSLLAIVAQREGIGQDEIRKQIIELQRGPKDPNRPRKNKGMK